MKNDEYFKACKQLCENIRSLREEKQISIKELSEMTGIRAEYLKKIEQGIAYGVLIGKHLFKIADSLKVSFRMLFKFL